MDALSRSGAFAIIALMIVAPTSASAQSQDQVPAPGPGSMPPVSQAPAQVELFRRAADEFIAAAAAGDMSKARQMISPATTSTSGPEAVERYLTGQVLPFFAEFKDVEKSVTISRTADAVGFVFYMYIVSPTDKLRPFVIYVVEEGGAKVIANILVDSFVEGRHCARIAEGWRCPDFR
jgi:hypothetical protein